MLAGNGRRVVTLATSPSLCIAECTYRKFPPPPAEAVQTPATDELILFVKVIEDENVIVGD